MQGFCGVLGQCLSLEFPETFGLAILEVVVFLLGISGHRKTSGDKA
jgi:hypothetical protein